VLRSFQILPQLRAVVTIVKRDSEAPAVKFSTSDIINRKGVRKMFTYSDIHPDVIPNKQNQGCLFFELY